MRSVAVVLPASMCAMMPMLRTFLRSVRTSCATFVLSSRSRVCGLGCASAVTTAPPGMPAARGARPAYRRGGSPAVVGEGLVRLGHLVRVLTTLHRGTEAVGGVEDLVHEPLGHRLLAALARVADEPAQRQRRRAVRLDLDRHLVSRTADATGLDL